MALLRTRNGLWLLGARILAFLQRRSGPNSVGAQTLWHFCVASMAPCNWLGRASTRWYFCDIMLALPLERSPLGIAAWS